VADGHPPGLRASPPCFAGFDVSDLPSAHGEIRARVGGAGPPLLLLHGCPQSHVMWHSTAPLLAERFTVVGARHVGHRGALPRFYDDVLAIWRAWAADVRGGAVDATHFLVEDRPEEVVAALAGFLAG
jgi:hypothetical protein